MTDTEQLRSFISSAFPLKAEELDALTAIWQPFECKRKTILTAAGETERYLYFVLEGVQRAFYIGGEKRRPLLYSCIRLLFPGLPILS